MTWLDLGWACVLLLLAAGIDLLAYAARLRAQARRPPPRQRRRRVRPLGFDRSYVVDGRTVPSATVAAVCADPAPDRVIG